MKWFGQEPLRQLSCCRSRLLVLRGAGSARLARIHSNGGAVNQVVQVYLGQKVDALCHNDLAKKTLRPLDSRSLPCNLACPV